MSLASSSDPRRGSKQISTQGHAHPLPSPAIITRGTPMGPPSQQSPMHTPRMASTPRGASFDESLRLPPLQNQSSKLHLSMTRVSDGSESERRVKSMEAMIMTIPYINKIKLLSKISPPLAAPGPTSPTHDIRGAIIAVEGSDASLVQEVGDFIRDHMKKEAHFAIKTWEDDSLAQSIPTSQTHDGGSRSPETANMDLAAASEDQGKDPFPEFLSNISRWHLRSQEIIKYITTTPKRSTESECVSPRSTASQSEKVFPVAVLPRGFSLCISDRWALRIPINDSYSPVDHWQWMATLWRGIVGPDLTIYVTATKEKDDTEKAGTVEIRNDCAAIVVTVADGGGLDEKTSRRLGFEVLEFVRGLDGGIGKG